MPVPFAFKRLWLLLKGSSTNRDEPKLDRLRAITNGERFVWAILPHAARSFAPSILLLPEPAARAAAVAYLYARILDTYEDLSIDPSQARDRLATFANRFRQPDLTDPPPISLPGRADRRDEAHLLLIYKCVSVDEVYRNLPRQAQQQIADLVGEMSQGMIEFSEIFESQGGVLEDAQQVLDYCHRVIGLPALFVIELLLGDLSGEHHQDALEVSELIQLANITRDIEKDLLRGVAYHPILREHLGSDPGKATTSIAVARKELILLATQRGGAFRRLLDSMDLPRFSLARAGAVMMMLFTDRHYRTSAETAGMRTWSGPRRVPVMILMALPAVFSRWWGNRILGRIELDLLAAE